MKTRLTRMALATVFGLMGGYLFACANVTSHLPRTPDGKVDVVKLLVWAQDGLTATCTSGYPGDVLCKLGSDAIDTATQVAKVHQPDADPRQLYASVLKSLQDSEATWPPADGGLLKDFFTWLTDALSKLIAAPVPTPAG